MAVRALGTKLSIEGEKEYKKALSEVNADLKVLGSQMKTATAQFKDNATSVEALSAKQEILSKKLEAQKSKVDIAREALAKASATYGEADQRTKNWQISLNNAQAELYELDRELAANREALDLANREADKGDSIWGRLRNRFQKADDDTKGLGDAIGGLAGKLGVDLPNGVTDAVNGLGNLSASSAIAVGAIGAVVGAIVSVEKKLFDVTVSAAAAADELLTTSAVTGVSTETLQEYAYASGLVDVSLDTITGSLTKLTRSMGDAQQGVEAQVDAFAALGVSYTTVEGSLRNSEDVFNDVIDALGSVTNETERDAIAMEILGRSAMDLNPLIKAGSDRMHELSEEAHDMGYVLESDALDALGEVDDSLEKMNSTFDTLKKQIAVEFSPSATKAIDQFSKGVSNVGTALNNSGIVSAFGMLLETAVDIIFPAEQLAEDTVPKLTLALRPLSQILAGIADTMDFISSLLSLDFKGAVKALGFGYSYGNGNNLQTLWEQWEQVDTNAATKAAGYGQYYANGQWYDYSRYKEIEAVKESQREIFETNSRLNPSMYNGMSFDQYWQEYASRRGYNAGGTSSWRGGWSWVGENGPELAYLPRGSTVVTAQESQLAGGDTYYITIDAKSVQEFNDIVRIVKAQRRTDRMHEG